MVKLGQIWNRFSIVEKHRDRIIAEARATISMILRGSIQCDQMAKLSFQYWANNNNENLSNVIKICPIRLRFLTTIK